MQPDHFLHRGVLEPGAQYTSRTGVAFFDLLLTAGLACLFLPWAVRSVTEATGALASLKVLHLLAAACAFLVVHCGVSALTGRFRMDLLQGPYRLWYGYLCLWGLWMAVWGWLHQAPLLNYLGELFAMVIFLAGVAVGALPANWRVLDRVYPLFLGVLGLPVVVLGVKLVGSLDPDSLKRGLVYTASAILIPSTLYALAPGRLSPPALRRLANAAFFVYAILQFLFAKRAPLVRVVVIFFLGYWVLPGWMGGQRAFRRVAGLFALGVAVSLLTVLVGERGAEEVFNRFEKLSAFSGLAAVPSTTDIWEDPRIENEMFRIKEIGYFYRGMTGMDVLVGTGIGSYCKAPEVAMQWTVSSLDSNELIGGKSTTHIGMFWPFYKGGAPYFILFHAGVLGALLSLKRFIGDPLKLSAWAFVLTYLLFSLIEGFWMNPGVELTTFLIGASLGVLMRR